MASPVLSPAQGRFQLRSLGFRAVVPVLVVILVGFLAASASAQTEVIADNLSGLAATPAVTHNYWTAGAPMPIAVTYQMTGVIAAKIYNVGGHSTNVIGNNQIYNPATDAWTTGAPLPTPTLNAASAVVGTTLYIFGGSTSSGITNEVWAYNSKTNAWTTKAAMPTARQGAVAVAENSIIYVIGGNDSSKTRLSTVESYDPATNDWATEAPLLVPKARSTNVLIGTTIVAAGGLTDTAVTGDNEGYNASTNIWTSHTSDPTPRSHMCNGLANGLVLRGRCGRHCGDCHRSERSLQSIDQQMDHQGCHAPSRRCSRIRGKQGFTVLLRRIFENFDPARRGLQQRTDLSPVSRFAAVIAVWRKLKIPIAFQP